MGRYGFMGVFCALLWTAVGLLAALSTSAVADDLAQVTSAADEVTGLPLLPDAGRWTVTGDLRPGFDDVGNPADPLDDSDSGDWGPGWEYHVSSEGVSPYPWILPCDYSSETAHHPDQPRDHPFVRWFHNDDTFGQQEHWPYINGVGGGIPADYLYTRARTDIMDPGEDCPLVTSGAVPTPHKAMEWYGAVSSGTFWTETTHYLLKAYVFFRPLNRGGCRHRITLSSLTQLHSVVDVADEDNAAYTQLGTLWHSGYSAGWHYCGGSTPIPWPGFPGDISTAVLAMSGQIDPQGYYPQDSRIAQISSLRVLGYHPYP